MYVCTRVLSVLTVMFLFIGAVGADVALPAILSDHAVLQASKATRIWGTAAAGEVVRVTIADAHAETTAGATGTWAVSLNLEGKGPGPFTLVVEGKNKLVVQDVLLGEVWICCGQSNMEFMLYGALGAKEEIAQSANPLLRQFAVQHVGTATPREAVDGKWTVAGPSTAGTFTAVGYYFGKSLQQALQVPVGLVNASWNSSPVEAWTSQEALDRDPQLKKDKDYWVHLTERFNSYVTQYQAWETQYQRQDRVT
ncbi:MAG TPA: acetyl esterase, partial [Armatimonadota bacterium]